MPDPLAVIRAAAPKAPARSPVDTRTPRWVPHSPETSTAKRTALPNSLFISVIGLGHLLLHRACGSRRLPARALTKSTVEWSAENRQPIFDLRFRPNLAGIPGNPGRAGDVTGRDSPAGAVADLPDQPLLHNRADQVSVAGVHQAAGQPAGPRRTRRLLGVEQSVVGAERPVEPHGVVQAGHRDAGERA